MPQHRRANLGHAVLIDWKGSRVAFIHWLVVGWVESGDGSASTIVLRSRFLSGWPRNVHFLAVRQKGGILENSSRDKSTVHRLVYPNDSNDA